MVNTYAVQSGGCRFESLWGFGFSLKGAHYEVDYSGKKIYLAGGLQCTLTSSCAKRIDAAGDTTGKHSSTREAHMHPETTRRALRKSDVKAKKS